MTELQNNLLTELDQVSKYEVVSRHSYFQLKYFVIGKEPTNQAKMWQCLREMKSRRDSLISLDLEIEDAKDKIELLDITIEKFIKDKSEAPEDPPYRVKEANIRIRQTERQKKAAELNLQQLIERKKWIEEESRFFLESFKNIIKIEPLKHFDDVESQKAYWSEKLSQKMNLKMLTHNQLDNELIETIVSLPDEMPIKKQALATLNLRHANMVRQLKETMQHLEDKKEEK